MYYLVGTKPNIEIADVENNNCSTRLELTNKGFIIVGQFGRKDYAEIWKDFHNDVINREELKLKLNI